MFSRQVLDSEAAARVLIFWPPVCIPFAIAAHTNRRACAPVTVLSPAQASRQDGCRGHVSRSAG